MKTIYLVRHAVAAEPGPGYPTDEVRPLTEEGAERWRIQVRGLRQLDVAPDIILTSPYVRCRETARFLAEGVGCTSVELVAALRPGGHLEDVLQAVGDCRHADSVALVGHVPSIGELAARLLGARGEVVFKKGAVCRIDVSAIPPRAPGTLVWLVPPKAQRALGEG
jgi:phosphohistidine phosphatase